MVEPVQMPDPLTRLRSAIWMLERILFMADHKHVEIVDNDDFAEALDLAYLVFRGDMRVHLDTLRGVRDAFEAERAA